MSSAAPPPLFQHCSDLDDVCIPPCHDHDLSLAHSSTQTAPTTFADSECLIVRGSVSTKT
jgi:hypothetical protein